MTHHPATASATPPPSPAMLAGNKGFSVSTEALDDTLANYPAAHVEILRWWWDLAKERAWSLSVLARQCGVSSTVLSRVFRGEYNAEIDSTIEKLARAKANFAEQVNNPDFIMTSLAKRMFAIFDKTRALQTVTIMWGQKGIGKTTIKADVTTLAGCEANPLLTTTGTICGPLAVNRIVYDNGRYPRHRARGCVSHPGP